MDFKVGDRVKFLNENGGGIITKVINSNMVNVAIEEGFEIPTLASNLIKIDLSKRGSSMFDEEFEIPQSTRGAETEPANDYAERTSPLIKYNTKNIFPEGIYLAYIPHEQKWLISGMLDIYLVNHTPYSTLFSLFLKEESGGFSGMDYDVVPSGSKLLITTIDRDELELWSEGVIQLLFHNDQFDAIPLPANCSFRAKPSKFYKEDNYRESNFLGEKAFLITLTERKTIKSTTMAEETFKYDDVQEQKMEAKPAEVKGLIDEHQTVYREAEVDLHIEALVEDVSSIEPSQILRKQINYFTQCLESAIARQYFKVTFIHGVGNGTLRTAIREIMKAYPNLEVRSAPMQQYGMGAIEVLIK